MGNGLLKTIDLLGNALMQLEAVIEQLNERITALEEERASENTEKSE